MYGQGFGGYGGGFGGGYGQGFGGGYGQGFGGGYGQGFGGYGQQGGFGGGYGQQGGFGGQQGYAPQGFGGGYGGFMPQGFGGGYGQGFGGFNPQMGYMQQGGYGGFGQQQGGFGNDQMSRMGSMIANGGTQGQTDSQTNSQTGLQTNSQTGLGQAPNPQQSQLIAGSNQQQGAESALAAMQRDMQKAQGPNSSQNENLWRNRQAYLDQQRNPSAGTRQNFGGGYGQQSMQAQQGMSGMGGLGALLGNNPQFAQMMGNRFGGGANEFQ